MMGHPGWLRIISILEFRHHGRPPISHDAQISLAFYCVLKCEEFRRLTLPVLCVIHDVQKRDALQHGSIIPQFQTFVIFLAARSSHSEQAQ